jgi:hypothetical protein
MKSVEERKATKFNQPIISDNEIQLLLYELARIEYERYKELQLNSNQRESALIHKGQSFNINLTFYHFKAA